MTKLLFTIELSAIVTALIFGILWLQNPNGPFEPYVFMATLIGTTVIDMVRRRIQVRMDAAEVRSSTATMMTVVASTLESQLPGLLERATHDQESRLREDLIDVLPSLLQKAIANWEQSERMQHPDLQAEISHVANHTSKSLAEAYGIDCLQSTTVELSLADAKPWRFRRLDD